jgi:hypothetical protein
MVPLATLCGVHNGYRSQDGPEIGPGLGPVSVVVSTALPMGARSTLQNSHSIYLPTLGNGKVVDYMVSTEPRGVASNGVQEQSP